MFFTQEGISQHASDHWVPGNFTVVARLCIITGFISHTKEHVSYRGLQGVRCPLFAPSMKSS